MIRSRVHVPVLIAFLSPMLLGCDTRFPTASSASAGFDRASSDAVSRPRVAVCPTNTTESVSGEIGAEGGSLEVAGHRLTIPAGALTHPARFTLTAPAGRLLEVAVAVRATEPSRFSAPAAVTISYERCKRQNLRLMSAAVSSVDPETGFTVASVDAETDPTLMTVTFSVDLSSDGDEVFVARGIYAVAY